MYYRRLAGGGDHSLLVGQGGAPAWSFRLLAIVFVVGFPVAMVIAWVVQVQPGGSWAIFLCQGSTKVAV